MKEFCSAGVLVFVPLLLPFVTRPIKDGLQQFGESFDGRRAMKLASSLWGTERSGVSVTNWQNFGGWEGCGLACRSCLVAILVKTILRAILKSFDGCVVPILRRRLKKPKRCWSGRQS